MLGDMKRSVCAFRATILVSLLVTACGGDEKSTSSTADDVSQVIATSSSFPTIPSPAEEPTISGPIYVSFDEMVTTINESLNATCHVYVDTEQLMEEFAQVPTRLSVAQVDGCGGLDTVNILLERDADAVQQAVNEILALGCNPDYSLILGPNWLAVTRNESAAAVARGLGGVLKAIPVC